MKKLVLIFIILKIFFSIKGQEIGVKEVFNAVSLKFDSKNIEISADSSVTYVGFNFNKMKPSSKNLYANTYVNVHYKNKEITKISIIDTTHLNRNVDFDIVYSSDDFDIMSVFMYYKSDVVIVDFMGGDTIINGNSSRETGRFFEGFMVNDKKKDISYIFYERYSNINILCFEGIKSGTKKSYILSNWSKGVRFSSISMILKVNRRLFPVERMVLHADRFISCSEIGYGENEIYETIYLYSTELNMINNLYDLSLNDLNELFEESVNYGFRFGPDIISMPLPYPNEYLGAISTINLEKLFEYCYNK
jgi:hypothetical protein